MIFPLSISGVQCNRLDNDMTLRKRQHDINVHNLFVTYTGTCSERVGNEYTAEYVAVRRPNNHGTLIAHQNHGS